MKRLLAISAAGVLAVGGLAGLAADTAVAKHHHKKHHHKKHHHKTQTQIKVTVTGWYLVTNHGPQTVAPGASVSACSTTDHHIAFMGMAFTWSNAKPPTIITWNFSGPSLNFNENYGLSKQSGSYPGTPYGVTAHAQNPQGSSGFVPGSYTGKISQKGKLLATETLTLTGC